MRFGDEFLPGWRWWISNSEIVGSGGVVILVSLWVREQWAEMQWKVVVSSRIGALHMWNMKDGCRADELTIANVHLVPGVVGTPVAQLGRLLLPMPGAAATAAERSGAGVIVGDFNCVGVEKGSLHRRVAFYTTLAEPPLRWHGSSRVGRTLLRPATACGSSATASSTR